MSEVRTLHQAGRRPHTHGRPHDGAAVKASCGDGAEITDTSENIGMFLPLETLGTVHR